MPWESELEKYQKHVAASLASLGPVASHHVCKSVWKVTVAHASGASVRILVGIDDTERGTFFLSILQTVDPFNGKSIVIENQTFRRITWETRLELLVTRARHVLDTATDLLQLPGARRPSPSTPSDPKTSP